MGTESDSDSDSMPMTRCNADGHLPRGADVSAAARRVSAAASALAAGRPTRSVCYEAAAETEEQPQNPGVDAQYVALLGLDSERKAFLSDSNSAVETRGMSRWCTV